jgi:hypothetical protein
MGIFKILLVRDFVFHGFTSFPVRFYPERYGQREGYSYCFPAQSKIGQIMSFPIGESMYSCGSAWGAGDLAKTPLSRILFLLVGNSLFTSTAEQPSSPADALAYADARLLLAKMAATFPRSLLGVSEKAR